VLYSYSIVVDLISLCKDGEAAGSSGIVTDTGRRRVSTSYVLHVRSGDHVAVLETDCAFGLTFCLSLQ
jgi:hypothetical protein